MNRYMNEWTYNANLENFCSFEQNPSQIYISCPLFSGYSMLVANSGMVNFLNFVSSYNVNYNKWWIELIHSPDLFMVLSKKICTPEPMWLQRLKVEIRNSRQRKDSL